MANMANGNAPANTKATDRTDALGTERIGKLLWEFSIPSIIAMLANSLYNIIDTFFVGHGVGRGIGERVLLGELHHNAGAVGLGQYAGGKQQGAVRGTLTLQVRQSGLPTALKRGGVEDLRLYALGSRSAAQLGGCGRRGRHG